MPKPFPQTEEEILIFWQENKIFEKSLAATKDKELYSFFDGPPFATGTPHYGHIVASIMKDAIPRFWTMKGYYVKRKWGWDCHGLPIENLAEKELGLKNKQDIEKKGVDKFNDYCRSIVMRYATEWKSTINRIGRWVDMEDDYKTMDTNYMESIWWVFKSLWDKDLIYQGYKSMHICPRCSTTLSNFEVTQGYKDVTDISATAKFKLLDEKNTYVLAWTTTPWTLIGNAALAVGENIEYVKIKSDNDFFITSAAYWEKLKESEKFVGAKIIEKIIGKDLVGKKYQPLFDDFQTPNLKNKENGWQILAADFVSTDEGTGVVHIAPAFGEDDMKLGQEKKLPFIQHVDFNGKFTNQVKKWAGLEVKPKTDRSLADLEIVKDLEERNLLFAQESYSHSYPHCWRCETPLLNYATESWFVAVTKIKENLVANNQNISWVPGFVKDGRFGKWLEEARDWAISRNRYWGAPLPVWICDKCKHTVVIGSVADLKEKGKISETNQIDLHKQHVDKIEFPCQVCSGTMKRVPEVLDCWFESGSMPYAQFHYPFENKEEFEKSFPADFIAEGMDQTRGWFYTLMVLSTALFGKEAFENVIVNGIVLAEDGQKMSKSKANYPDPTLVIDKYGADSIRYYLINSPVLVGENLSFAENGVLEVMRTVVMTLLNVLSFLSMFAGQQKVATNVENSNSKNILDQWILSRLNELNQTVTQNLEKYTLPKATRPIGEFISDLSTWYLRRSRDRFKGDDEVDRQAVIKTLRYVLVELSKLMAPFMPFLAEHVWQKVSGLNFSKSDESVHLQKWPEVNLELINKDLAEKMATVRSFSSLALSARMEAGIKVRQPLAEIKVNQGLSEELAKLIRDEANVKQVNFVPSSDWTNLANSSNWTKASDNSLEIALNTELTPELEEEGLVRELIRQINQLRKNQNLTIQDQVEIFYSTDDKKLSGIIEKNSAEITKNTVSSKISKTDQSDEMSEVKVGDGVLKIMLKN